MEYGDSGRSGVFFSVPFSAMVVLKLKVQSKPRKRVETNDLSRLAKVTRKLQLLSSLHVLASEIAYLFLICVELKLCTSRAC